MTVINIRGTGGSGKSTLVRSVMDLYPEKFPNHVMGRSRPESYLLSTPGHRPLCVIGHYDTPCGGCDTIKTVDRVYAIVGEVLVSGADVLYEGIMVSDDVKRAVALSQQPGVDLHVILLSTPVDLCLAAIADRRAARGDTRPLDPKNTVSRARAHENGCKRLEAAGVSVYRLSRDEAFAKVKELLGL